MVKSIYLQDGEEIFVDDEDYERVNQFTWHKVYQKNKTRIIQNSKHISLQSYINKKKDSYQIKKTTILQKIILLMVILIDIRDQELIALHFTKG
ncbi:hypothetical protein ACX3NC_000421 [Staphylococcus pseudintermedius]|nr:hypothetical protein [Staphylococcus pseudintermedius]MDK3819863.1 hypothetical protein [Staphylococcus pseudintermedius]